MALRKSYLYLNNPERLNLSPITSTSPIEFEEAEIWNSHEVVIPSEAMKKPIPISRPSKKTTKKSTCIDQTRAVAATSLPVNIPDWSKILRGEYKTRIREAEDDDEDEDGRVPPHEYLARTRVASFSVHEGIGRTLKGRDLSRVRNAIWKQTGFED